MYDRYTESREAIGEEIARTRGSVLVRPFDDPFVIEGQGTTGLEIVEQAEAVGADIDQLLCGASGGGLGGVGGMNSGGFMDGPRLAFQGAGFQQQHQQQTPQQQHASAQHLGMEYSPNVRAQPNKGRIREVWKHNLHEEMATLRKLVDHYPYIAMVCRRLGRGWASDSMLTIAA